MHVRAATPEDAGTVAALNRHVQGWHAATYPEVFKPDPDPDALNRHFAGVIGNPDVTVFLSGDPPVAYAICVLQRRPESLFSPARTRLLIDHVATAPEARRQGHARALFEAAAKLARDHACDEITLDTWAKNTEAHAFFRAMGFTPQRMLFQKTP